MRPDTRPIEFLVRRQASENSSCQTGGIHTRTAAIRPTDLETPLCKVDRKDMHLCHLPFLRERHHGAEQASYSDAGRRGHPTHQFTPVSELCRNHGVSDASIYKLKGKLGGMDVTCY